MVVDGTVGELLDPVMTRLERRYVQGAPKGLSTGLRDLDSLTGGGRPGHLWVVNGPSGCGKTSFALTMAREVAFRQMQAVRWMTTADDALDVMEMVLSAEARVALFHLRTGMTDDNWARLARVMGEIAEAPLSLAEVEDDALGHSMESLAGSPPTMLVLDSLDDPLDTEALGRMKALTEQLDCWTVVVTGDTRGVRPRVVDRAQDDYAEVVIWVDRPDLDDWHSPRAGEVDLRVTRSRSTPIGTVTVAQQLQFARFVEVTPGPGLGPLR